MAALQKVEFAEGLFGYEVGEKSAPGIVVIQEWWGVNDTIKEHAAYLAQELGFRCLVPDLYKGTVAVEVMEAEHNMSSLDFPNAVKELSTAATYLKTTGSPKIGVIGFCMGGALSLASIEHAADVSAGVVCYGLPPGAICEPSKVCKPVQGHFGEKDNLTGFSDPESAKKVEATIKGGGNSDVEFFIYPEVGHAFLNSTPAPHASFEVRQEKQGFPPYHKDQATVAWGRITDFFKKHLAKEE